MCARLKTNKWHQGDEAEGKAALRRAALPRGASMAAVTLADAVAALAGPKALGPHPADGEAVALVAQGPFGPYLKHRTLSVAIPKVRFCPPLRSLPPFLPWLSFCKRPPPPCCVLLHRAKNTAPTTFQTKQPDDKRIPQRQGLDPAALTLEAAVALVDAKAARLAKRGRDPYAPRAAAAAGGKKKAQPKQKKDKAAAGAKGGGGGRALTGYQLFGKLNRASVLAEASAGGGGGSAAASPGRAMALVAAAWKALSDAEREAWGARAREAASAAEAGGSGGGSGGEEQQQKQPAAGRKRAAPAAAASKKKGGGGGGAAAASAKGAKSSGGSGSGSGKPLSAYQQFIRANKERLSAAAKGAGATLLAAAAAEWRALGDADKRRYGEGGGGR